MTYEFSKPRITRKIGTLEIHEDYQGYARLSYRSYSRNDEQMSLPVEALANLSLLLIEFAEETIRRDAAFERFKAIAEEEPAT